MTDADEKEPTQIVWNAKTISLLVIICLVVFGAIFLTADSMDKVDADKWAKDTAEWKSTSGQITNLSVYYSGQKLLQFLKTGSWYPKVEYQYVLDGTPITGEEIGIPRIKFDNEEDAADYLKNFEVGNKVTVYYDPKFITRSALTHGEKLTLETKIPLTK